MSWDQLLFACVEIGYRQTFQPILHNDLCFVATPQTLASQKFVEVGKQVVIDCARSGL
jgi:hypothetical protein